MEKMGKKNINIIYIYIYIYIYREREREREWGSKLWYNSKIFFILIRQIFAKKAQ